MKDNKDIEIMDGTVVEALPNTMFKVEINGGKVIMATLKGILRRRYVRIFPGDRVRLEMNKYDEERGRIIEKYRR